MPKVSTGVQQPIASTRLRFSSSPLTISRPPVSYTHLDVYKRQVLDVAWMWLPVDDEGAAYAQLQTDLESLDRRAESKRSDGIPVLRLVTTRD